MYKELLISAILTFTGFRALYNPTLKTCKPPVALYQALVPWSIALTTLCGAMLQLEGACFMF